MKLYLYDHCPFCIRAEMVGNYKEVPYTAVYLLNDDEETCYRLINAKQVPILEFGDGHAMPESLDIANKFDEIGNPAKIISPKKDAEDILAHINSVAQHTRALLYPRNILMQGLPEFATQNAKNYFQNKKEKSLGYSFEEAMQQTTMHQAAVEKMLATLPALPQNESGTISWDDVFIYPILRNLTCVKGLQFPSVVFDYIERVKNITHTQTYFDRAV